MKPQPIKYPLWAPQCLVALAEDPGDGKAFPWYPRISAPLLRKLLTNDQMAEAWPVLIKTIEVMPSREDMTNGKAAPSECELENFCSHYQMLPPERQDEFITTLIQGRYLHLAEAIAEYSSGIPKHETLTSRQILSGSDKIRSQIHDLSKMLIELGFDMTLGELQDIHGHRMIGYPKRRLRVTQLLSIISEDIDQQAKVPRTLPRPKGKTTEHIYFKRMLSSYLKDNYGTSADTAVQVVCDVVFDTIS